MFQKIKTGLLLLCCATVLSGCADQFKIDPVRLEIPKDAVSCDPFPLPPDVPMNCALASGEPAMCQSEIAIWIETEVMPSYQRCLDANKFMEMKNGYAH